jgi:hypothetical protein
MPGSNLQLGAHAAAQLQLECCTRAVAVLLTCVRCLQLHQLTSKLTVGVFQAGAQLPFGRQFLLAALQLGSQQRHKLLVVLQACCCCRRKLQAADRA